MESLFEQQSRNKDEYRDEDGNPINLISVDTPEQGGSVLSFADGVATVSGLYDVAIGERLDFEDSYDNAVDASGDKGMEEPEIFGVVEDVDEFSVKCLVFGEERFVKQGDRVKASREQLKIPVTSDLLGKVIDPFCRLLPIESDKEEATWFEKSEGRTQKGNRKRIHKVKKKVLQLPIEREAPSILDRAKIVKPLYSGITAIDSMLPIGMGQRMLMIGDRSLGKTALAVDTIINQAIINEKLNGNKDFKSHDPQTVYCIYVAIGKKISEIKQLYKQLSETTKGGVDAMKYTVIIVAAANDPAPLLYAAPFSGCTIGEYFRDLGRNALIIYDDLSKHANAYRQISLLLKRPPGREAYPGDIFYLHSRLLERAAKISDKEFTSIYKDNVLDPEYGPEFKDDIKPGGSLTAIPMVETKLNDYSSYIATNIVSITDGQIFLNEELKNKGIMPAINVGISVSRVGLKAQYPWMQFAAKGIREFMAEYREKDKYKAYNPDPTEADKRILERGERFVRFFRQDQYHPVESERQILGLIGVKAGFYDLLPIKEEDDDTLVKAFEKFVWETAEKEIEEILKEFNNNKAKIIRESIEKVIEFYNKTESKFFESKKSGTNYSKVLELKQPSQEYPFSEFFNFMDELKVKVEKKIKEDQIKKPDKKFNLDDELHKKYIEDSKDMCEKIGKDRDKLKIREEK